MARKKQVSRASLSTGLVRTEDPVWSLPSGEKLRHGPNATFSMYYSKLVQIIKIDYHVQQRRTHQIGAALTDNDLCASQVDRLKKELLDSEKQMKGELVFLLFRDVLTQRAKACVISIIHGDRNLKQDDACCCLDSFLSCFATKFPLELGTTSCRNHQALCFTCCTVLIHTHPIQGMCE